MDVSGASEVRKRTSRRETDGQGGRQRAVGDQESDARDKEGLCGTGRGLACVKSRKREPAGEIVRVVPPRLR
ncbi:hypothetical protein Dda_4704 [Drechslerella dactyloides]|uniref:Uncharacterized protein n=1 Tax=Drechslerella dactyloides TaxID=74499 RepID=A0AAD6IXE7_DREDA|nr:hypothetical protein Dda_4704 [Drechslerella dactyloides]